MYRLFIKTILITVGLLAINIASYAQCAMCRATLENNFSNGEIGTAANINIGILYLFVFPYILIGTVAYLWYRNVRKQKYAE